MKVSAILSGEFTAGVRNRGADYFRAGAVHIDYGSPTEVRATVYGTETYAVEIGTEPTEIRTFCECPYFESDGACKHLWATILKAESKGYLSAARHFAGLSEPDGRAHAEPERPVFGWPDGGRATKRADWQRRLEEIENSRARPGTSQVWPERRQLLYVINVGMSRSERRVVLELLTRERKQKGDGWNRLKQLRWEREKIPLLGAGVAARGQALAADVRDEPLLSAAAGARSASTSGVGRGRRLAIRAATRGQRRQRVCADRRVAKGRGADGRRGASADWSRARVHPGQGGPDRRRYTARVAAAAPHRRSYRDCSGGNGRAAGRAVLARLDAAAVPARGTSDHRARGGAGVLPAPVEGAVSRRVEPAGGGAVVRLCGAPRFRREGVAGFLRYGRACLHAAESRG
ncbi:MAG: SWIM zinc finger family protein [Acidobacteria bacterium]|nr:SWIM zinc finger family protein [Acidobacteriota bacterium]